MPDGAAGWLGRRALLAGIAAGLALPARADAPASVVRPRRRPAKARLPDVRDLIAAAGLGGTVSCCVADTLTGVVLEAVEPDLPQPPASVAKAVTALYALDRLGAEHRFVTRILAVKPGAGAASGLLSGDLVLAGSGDPTLDTDALGDLAARLAQGGLRSVEGRFLLYDGALPQVARIAADQPDHVGYNPSLSGLNLNFNRVHFEWRRAGGEWLVAMDARGARFVPIVSMARMAVVARTEPLFTYACVGGRDEWTVAQAALGNGGSRWLPVRNPGLYAADVFGVLARAQGITLPEAEIVGALPAGAREAPELGRVASAPLTDILRDMLRFSTNVTAEAVGLCASGAGTLPTSGLVMSGWIRARQGGAARFVDHSGLGADSRVSAAEMVRVMSGGRANLLPLLRDVRMRDASGRPIDGHPVRVPAKSGTLNFVSGLAGFVVPPGGGRQLTFAVFAADPERRAALRVEEREAPPGGTDWTARARRLIGQLVARWADAYA